jgi:chromosomal replication initiator protein
LRFDSEVVELSGPDRFFCSWIKNNYLMDIRSALEKIGNGSAEILFSTNNTKLLQLQPQTNKETPAKQLRLPNFPEARQQIKNLNPRYIFDEFVVGESNAIAHSACHALANGDTSLSQCLYINAGTGLGKSHLTHAVAHHLMSHKPGIRLNYLTTKQLTAEMVQSIKANAMENFKSKYGSCDVLLMEDMQSLTGKAKTQEEIASLLDILLETGKTVIFTGSKTPKEISDLDPGVRSRLSSGLITTILPPDLKTRILIIGKKAKEYNLSLSEPVILYLAENIQGDIRRIKSAILGLKAKGNLRKMAPDFDMVKEVLADIIDRQQNLTPELIRDFIARQFEISVDDIQSKSRKKDVAFPRQVSMFLARKHTEKALSDIGQAFNRDHSTVVHAVKKITVSMARSTSIRGQVDLLSDKLLKKYL